MMQVLNDIGFEPRSQVPDFNLDDFDIESILGRLGLGPHRAPRLVWTGVGLLPVVGIDLEDPHSGLACLEEAVRLLGLHAAPPPQLRPATSSTGISHLVAEGKCAGDILAIHGAGFGAVQPPGVVLLLPRMDGCAPVDVPVANCSDTLIRVRLPADISSGPVGFGDAAYLKFYNAWVDQINAIADERARLPCAPEPIIAAALAITAIFLSVGAVASGAGAS